MVRIEVSKVKHRPEKHETSIMVGQGRWHR